MRNVLVAMGIVLMAASVAVADNTVASSTMYFQGSLTDLGSGVYGGTLAMADTTGFDVYAKNGAQATYDTVGTSGELYTAGVVSEHDAYTTAGGWGTYYDPDCADWYNYQIRFESGKWYLEYNGNVGNDGILTGASAAPMSGDMDWDNMFATENGTGAYYDGMGTAERSGYAAGFASNTGQSTVGAWDMDWNWGSEYVPLEYAGFSVEMTDLGGGEYGVTLTPTPEPGTIAMLVFGGLTALAAAWFRRRKA